MFAQIVRAKVSAAFSAAFSRNRQPARPDMAYLDDEPLLIDRASGTPVTLSPTSA